MGDFCILNLITKIASGLFHVMGIVGEEPSGHVSGRLIMRKKEKKDEV